MKKILLTLGILSAIAMIPSASFAQDNSSSCLSLADDLSFGMSGSSDVLALQGFLASQDYLSATPNGTFGPMTLQAVKDYQASNEIPATGFVGPLTRKSLNDISCGGMQNQVSQSTNTAAIPNGTTTPATDATAVDSGFVVTQTSTNIRPAKVSATAPMIYSLSPVSGAPGTQVIITGSNFDRNANAVYFNGSKIASDESGNFNFYSPDGKSITFYVPAQKTDDCTSSICTNAVSNAAYPSGAYSVRVLNAAGTSASISFWLDASAAGN